MAKIFGVATLETMSFEGLSVDQSDPKNYLSAEQYYYDEIESYFQDSSGTYTEKMHAFARFTPRQAISYFMMRQEAFRQILDVHGSVFDFGLYRGSSFFTWQQLSAILEPYNHARKIVGFDSFGGFSEITERDQTLGDEKLKIKQKGAMAYEGKEEIDRGIELFDSNRPLGHVNKGRVIKGELPISLKDYLQESPHTIIALANFGLGLYEPTLEILKLIKPRLTKGSILVFEELDQSNWPGETEALAEVFGLMSIKLNRVPYCPQVSWLQIGQ